MPRTRECSFCGADIEPGTGTMFVRTNGATVHFCSSKCESNADLGRRARDLEWTDTAQEADAEQERRAAAAAADAGETEADEGTDDAAADEADGTDGTDETDEATEEEAEA